MLVHNVIREIRDYTFSQQYTDLYLGLAAQLEVGLDESVAMIEHHTIVLQFSTCPSGWTAEGDFSVLLLKEKRQTHRKSARKTMHSPNSVSVDFAYSISTDVIFWG